MIIGALLVGIDGHPLMDASVDEFSYVQAFFDSIEGVRAGSDSQGGLLPATGTVWLNG